MARRRAPRRPGPLQGPAGALAGRSTSCTRSSAHRRQIGLPPAPSSLRPTRSSRLDAVGALVDRQGCGRRENAAPRRSPRRSRRRHGPARHWRRSPGRGRCSQAFTIGVSRPTRSAAAARASAASGVALAPVDGGGGPVGQGAHGRDLRAHRQQHPAHVGVLDDRRPAAGAPALDPRFAGVGERLLVGALGQAQTLVADGETGVVHHREHAAHAALFGSPRRKPTAPSPSP